MRHRSRLDDVIAPEACLGCGGMKVLLQSVVVAASSDSYGALRTWVRVTHPCPSCGGTGEASGQPHRSAPRAPSDFCHRGGVIRVHRG